MTAFAWTADHVVGHPGLGERYRDEMLQVAHREIATAREAAVAAEPDLDVRTQVEIGAPIGVLGSEAQRAQLVVLQALVEASNSAQLVVVGSRGRGNVGGLMLGSVSHGVLHRAHCPIAIVRPETAY